MIIWMKIQIKCQHPALRLHESSAWVTVAGRTQPASLAACLQPARPGLLGAPAVFLTALPQVPDAAAVSSPEIWVLSPHPASVPSP